MKAKTTASERKFQALKDLVLQAIGQAGQAIYVGDSDPVCDYAITNRKKNSMSEAWVQDNLGDAIRELGDEQRIEIGEIYFLRASL